MSTRKQHQAPLPGPRSTCWPQPRVGALSRLEAAATTRRTYQPRVLELEVPVIERWANPTGSFLISLLARGRLEEQQEESLTHTAPLGPPCQRNAKSQSLSAEQRKGHGGLGAVIHAQKTCQALPPETRGVLLPIPHCAAS